MLANYLTVAIRNVARHKLYSAINIAGLTVGFVCAVFILLFVRDEASYDRWIAESEDLYLVQESYHALGLPPSPWSIVPFPLVEAMKAEIPEVIAMTRHRVEKMTIYIGDRQFAEPVTVADPNLFELIKLPLLIGDAARVLADPNSIVLSSNTARKYFGAEDPLGKTVTISRTKCGQAPAGCAPLLQGMLVTGVMQDLPPNTHLAIEMVVPITSAVSDLTPGLRTSWINNSVRGYVRLAPGSDLRAVQEKLNAILDKNITTQTASDGTKRGSSYMRTEFVPFRDIHFSNGNNKNPPLTPAGSWTTVYGFAAIGVMIVLLACFNFTNLATARATLRAREISLRKVMGAKRGQLIQQFLGESLLMAFASLAIALALVEMLMPSFNALLGKSIAFNYIADWSFVVAIVGIGVLAGLLSGIYPAFVLSNVRPANVLRTNATRQSGSTTFRTSLVVLQFAVSIGLGIAVLTVFAQVSYMRSTNLGFHREGVIILDGTDIPPDAREGLLRVLAASPEIARVAKGNRVPLDGGLLRTGIRRPGEGTPETAHQVEAISASPDFHEVYGIPLLAGRPLSGERPGDVAVVGSPYNAVISAEAARILGYTPEEAIGKTLLTGPTNWEATVVGVAANLAIQGPKILPLPVLYRHVPANQTQIAIRVRDGRMASALPVVEDTWNAIAPAVARRQEFLTDNYAKLLDTDDRQSRIFNIFVIVAIAIAGMGLFGLAAFTAERRTREIGVRKAYGARTRDIVLLILWQFSIPVLIANLIAWPIAYYYLNAWLEGFALRISLSPLFFVASGIVALFVACATIYVQARRVARANPINALRYE